MAELTIAEAAARLGISKEAMRSRVQRRRVQARKRADGQWYVIVPDDTDASPRPTADATDAIGHDAVDALPERVWEVMREQVRFLRDQNIQQARIIEEMRRDHARAEQEWRVLLQTSQRLIPATVPDAPQAPERPGDGESPPQTTNVAPGGAGEAERALEKPQRWPWWMRILAGK